MPPAAAPGLSRSLNKKQPSLSARRPQGAVRPICFRADPFFEKIGIMMKHFSSLVTGCTALCLAGCLALTGCAPSSSASSQAGQASSQAASSSSGSQEQTQPETDTLKVGYSISAGFNPYVNNDLMVLQVSDLVSEKLVEISPEMQLDYRVASSIISSGQTVTIQLRSGLCFADGTPISAEDVAASINAARSSATYSGSLAHVTDVQVQGGQVVLTLSRADSLFAWLCTFPVMKAAEVASTQPTASGRYTYGEDNTLVPNGYSQFGSEGTYQTIELVDTSSYDALVSGLSVGSIDLYATTKESVSTAGYNSRTTSFQMNYLVFLGVNSEGNTALQDARLRQALSAALDRDVLCQRAYYGGALPARGAINPLYPCVTGLQNISVASDLSQCETLMKEMGYEKHAADGLYYDASGRRLELSLLVCTDSALKRSAATIIKEQLSEAGFSVTLEETDDFEGIYSQKIANGEFDLYIGEVKLYNNMDLSPFFEGGALSSGIQQNPDLAAAYQAFTADSNQAEAFEKLFGSQLPWLPLCWRSGTLVTSKQVTGIIPSVSNVFYSMQGSLPDSSSEAAS